MAAASKLIRFIGGRGKRKNKKLIMSLYCVVGGSRFLSIINLYLLTFIELCGFDISKVSRRFIHLVVEILLATLNPHSKTY